MFRLVTQNPIAHESLDHLYPRGVKNDDTHCLGFVEQCERLFPAKSKIRFLDLGCAAGGLVHDFYLRGHESFGLEGSDYCKKIWKGAWGIIPNHLRTCDITKPFEILSREGELVRFDVISAWEFLEHIHKNDLPTVFENIKKHLSPDGFFIGSVSNQGDAPTHDRQYHQTIEQRSWWMEFVNGQALDPMYPPFSGDQYPRGPESTYRDPGFYLMLRRRHA